MGGREIVEGVYRAACVSCHAGRLLAPFSVRGDSVIALGKAAVAMTQAAGVVRGVVVFPRAVDLPGLRVLEGGHPLPDSRSLVAGAAVRDFATSLPVGSRVVALLSGGASALVEDLASGWTLAVFRAETRRLMNDGADITALNAFRRSASRIKGGGLARDLAHCEVHVYVLSDVHGSDFATIGSGPFWTGDEGIPHTLIGDNSTLLDAASRALSAQGFRVRVLPWIGGEARDEGRMFAGLARKLGAGEALIAGGEPTVMVRGDGVGGRAQEFALAASEIIFGESDLMILAAGSDGRDGDTDAAGATADGSSWDGHSQADLDRSNSNAWARRTGAMIPEWTTSTNVNDLFLALRT